MPAIVRIGKLQMAPMNAGMLMSFSDSSDHSIRDEINIGVGRFFTPPRTPMKYTLSGFTLDSTGAVLGNCSIEVFETVNGVVTRKEPKGRLVAMTTSDANGAYSVEVYSAPGVTFQVDAYKAGSPDVAGTTLNTLTGTQVA